jgi:tRNA threonylcarbamoyladenosine biosynthesis protein TsaB
MLLAIDTSTALTGVACYDESGLLGECTWDSGRNHTAHLMPQLQLLLRHIQRHPDEVQAVAVARGPGSWSGLRVGMSVAKGMAVAGGLALLGVGTLDVLAAPHQHRRLPVVPLLRLGRERFAVAWFDDSDGWRRLGHYENVTLDELCARIDEPTLFCGDLDTATREHLRRGTSERAVFPTLAANLRRPGYLAELAWPRFVAGDHDSLATLEPLYLGEPVKPPAARAG